MKTAALLVTFADGANEEWVEAIKMVLGGLNKVTSPVPAGTPAIGQLLRTA